MSKTAKNKKSRKRRGLIVKRRNQQSKGVSKKDIEEIINRQTMLLNPAAAALDNQGQRIAASLSDPTKSADRLLHQRRQEIDKMVTLRKIFPNEAHSLSAVPAKSFPDPQPEPKKPEERAYHAPEPPPREGEEVWTKPDNTAEVSARVFLEDSLKGQADSVKSFGFDVFFKYLFGNVKMTVETFKVNGVEIDKHEYRAIISFIHDVKLNMSIAPSKTKELLYFVAHKMKEATKSFFRSGLVIPSATEARTAINQRLGPEQIKEIKNKEAFVEQVRDQMLLENVRNKFFPKKSKSNSWGDTIKNILTLGMKQHKLSPDEDDVIESSNMTDVINNVPKQERGNLKEVLRVMKKSGGLTWNEKGELVMGENVLKGSNISRITKYLFNADQQLHSHKPIGSDTFITEMMKNQKLIDTRKAIEIQRNRNGGLSLVRLGVNLVDIAVRLASLLRSLNIPWYVWIAASMRANITQFSTVTDTLKQLPIYATSGTFLESVGTFTADTVGWLGNVTDSVIESPETKAAVTIGLGYAYDNSNVILNAVQTALISIGTILTYTSTRRMLNR